MTNLIFLIQYSSVYVDASDLCNTAAFQLGQTAIGTSIPARSWNLKVRSTTTYFPNESIQVIFNVFKGQPLNVITLTI
jgi:hypothetical protein